MMIKKSLFLLAIVATLFSCEAESFDESIATIENTPQETPDLEPGKIIDTYIESDGGLNN
ncbi:hypothetical protein [Aquimarina algiphila]|uniref:hypothetical protein n=1 Tax=Aquimarina algiphila TaxID=2047982 RepID=UPI00232B3E91|nr:hypothetical protein [Aquimarina algiphila]